MTEENYNDKKYTIAEGPSEFKSNPADFMSQLGEGAMPFGIHKKIPKTTNDSAPVVDPSVAGLSATDSNAMGDLLSRLKDDVTFAAEQTLRNPETGPVLKKALITESNKGLDWQVVLTESNGQDEYTIKNVYSSKSFFDSVALMESARKICSLLEAGNPINSKKIQSVLYYDALYRSHYAECINVKRLHKKATTSSRRGILESKFESAKEKARSAKKNIKAL